MNLISQRLIRLTRFGGLVQIKVMIGIPTVEYARRADFYDYVDLMQKPDGTVISRVHGQSPARGRNLIIDEALKYGCTHIFFVDDDVLLPPDTLLKLLARDKDIITGLYLMRNHPHQPIIFDVAMPDGRCMNHFLNEGESGVIEVVACGLGSCLIKTSIFEKLEKPYIRLGELEQDHWCDDIGFFQRVRKAGLKIHCDLDCPVGHIASVAIWPNKINGKWHVSYDTMGRATVDIPAFNPRTLMKEEKKNVLQETA